MPVCSKFSWADLFGRVLQAASNAVHEEGLASFDEQLSLRKDSLSGGRVIVFINASACPLQLQTDVHRSFHHHWQ